MGQAGPKMRRATGAHEWWCPACQEMHPLPDQGWTFNGNLQAPTFTPSFRHTGKQRVVAGGKWTGEWRRGPDGKALDWVCHYIITDGVAAFCPDCTHDKKGQKIPMPDLPPELRD